MRQHYRIIKVLNNSCLLVSDGYHETIIIGKGLGFQRSVNDEIPENILIEKQFHLLSDSDYSTKSQMPKAIIQNTAEILAIITEVLGKEMSEHSAISLGNHVAAMLVRIENKEIFINPFHHETLTLYSEAYELAVTITQTIKDTINIELPEPETDFLTLYIHGIRSGYDNQNIILRNAIISDVSEVLETQLGFVIDKRSSFYARFITHIKFLIQRLTKDEPIPSIQMLDEIANRYPKYMAMSYEISDVIGNHLNVELSRDEQAYIALHLARLSFGK